MEITIQKAESQDDKQLVLIWFGDKQVMLNQDEFKGLKENIRLFENNGTAQEVLVQEQPKFVSSTSEGICKGELCVIRSSIKTSR